VNEIGEELSNYLKHSYQTHLSLHSISAVTYLLLHSFSLNAADEIGPEGTSKLSEALKSNTTLTAPHQKLLLGRWVFLGKEYVHQSILRKG
jgi:hypothetical protein